MLGAAIVTGYTMFGGMVSVAWTDFMQMTIIIIGMLYIAWFVGEQAGGVHKVLAHAQAAGRTQFLPEPKLRDMLWFFGAAITMMFGSIPQQDVFQRVTSARTVRISVWATVAGGVLYFCFSFVPMYLGYSAFLIDTSLVKSNLETNPQHILPQLVLSHTPQLAQVMFFGALLSAIMSTASGTLLAPSVTFTENVLKRFLRKDLPDRQLLWTMRAVVAGFAVTVTLFALNSDSGIYEMVGNAYKVTLVGAFVPLVAGLYWKRANSQGNLAGDGGRGTGGARASAAGGIRGRHHLDGDRLVDAVASIRGTAPARGSLRCVAARIGRCARRPWPVPCSPSMSCWWSMRRCTRCPAGATRACRPSLTLRRRGRATSPRSTWRPISSATCRTDSSAYWRSTRVCAGAMRSARLR
jgi:threonine/homoserine/homoserine lactone efflux protein